VAARNFSLFPNEIQEFVQVLRATRSVISPRGTHRRFIGDLEDIDLALNGPANATTSSIDFG